MRQTVRIGTFYGIAVGVNWSVALILALFAWELAVYILPTHSGTLMRPTGLPASSAQ